MKDSDSFIRREAATAPSQPPCHFNPERNPLHRTNQTLLTSPLADKREELRTLCAERQTPTSSITSLAASSSLPTTLLNVGLHGKAQIRQSILPIPSSLEVLGFNARNALTLGKLCVLGSSHQTLG